VLAIDLNVGNVVLEDGGDVDLWRFIVNLACSCEARKDGIEFEMTGVRLVKPAAAMMFL
jgi:hypothetical protein